MTRYARAKGSKASNERLPDEPTPWHVMKQQLEDSTTSKQPQEQKTKSAKELLRERDEPYYGDLGGISHDWAEFQPEKEKTSKKTKTTATDTPSSKNKRKSFEPKVAKDDVPASSPKKAKKRKSGASADEPTTDDNRKNLNSADSIPLEEKKKKKLKERETSPTEREKSENLEKRKKKKEKTSQNSSPNKKIAEEKPEVTQTTDKPAKLSKRQKRNRKNKLKPSEVDNPESRTETTPGAFNTEGNDWSSDVKFGRKKPSKPNTEESQPTNDVPKNPENLRKPFKNPPNKFNSQKITKKRKPPKIRDDKEHKRRKPDPGATKVIINGMEVSIVLYDGFPVKKEDADRLKELRQQMVMKGIPRSEINAAMKLERRRAEKSLARIKKNVCFHCRKAGHNLSDCPDLGKEEAATGICFKCGSTEHTHFECKVTKKEEFGYAKCFICREQGHIAKQCPDNPKGLYPQGGACKICGDVTHLKKDCPDLLKQKEEKTLTLDTISDTVETLEVTKKEETKKVDKKIVKF